MKFLCFMIIFYSFFLAFLYVDQASSISAYTIKASQSLKDGQLLTSQSETFELGFFSPSNSKNRYLGIWYKKIPLQTIVWVANRDSPLNDSSGVFMISSTGNLVILNRTNQVVWSTNSSKTAASPIVEFLESGNLVLRDNKSDGYLWQSFDHPTDTLLPGMKLGWDLRTGLNRYLTSWKSIDDPSTGDYTFGIELNEYPEPVMKNGSSKYYRSGPWNGIRNSGSPELRNNIVFINTVVHNKTDVYYSYQLVNRAVTARLMVKQSGSDGQINRLAWVDQRQNWLLQAPIPVDRCDSYGLCGAGATCDINDVPVCECLKGFKPKSTYDYNEMDWSQGCQHATPLDCHKGDGFLKFTELKLPDTTHTWLNTSMNLEECRYKCLKNCSCMAYANSDISGSGSGCAMWFGDLVDIRKLLGAGQDLYIRMAASELATDALKGNGSGSGTKKPLVIITISVILAFFVLGSGVCFIFREKIIQKVQKVSSKDRAHNEGSQDSPFGEVFIHGKRDYQGEKNDDLDLNLFDMDTIVKATYNFSDISLLGQGGFGCVYKGTLENGEEIAVKRLSKNSGQGVEEFKNEVMLIARLQHRNLVRLLGLCAEGQEKILVYEYMENKSLDAFLFDKTLNHILDWPQRFNIIVGISRGLLYLHQDSRFRIIHRDLKTSNVLLDGEMNPKISDFGMARIFGGDDAETETKRIVGTYGYMSPEYAMDGIFSVKSDVFSFGVLVLEIISGKKNRGFFCSEEQLNLLGYAWKLFKEGKALELIDETIKDSFVPNQALRCIHIGLLCVQENAKDRPTMPSVVLMLSTDTTKLQQPRQPGFSYGKSYFEKDTTSTSKRGSYSANDLTVTNLEAR